MQKLGAISVGPGEVEFRVWAPHADSVAVRLDPGTHPLEPAGDGTWSGDVAARAGDDYAFVLDGGPGLADPCSRWQPQGVHGSSRVVDTAGFEIAPGPGLALENLVL